MYPDRVELTEIKAELDRLGIKYVEDEFHKIYVSDNQEDEGMWAYRYIRISADRGDLGYYIRDTGIIYEDVPFEEVIDMVKECVGYDEAEE